MNLTYVDLFRMGMKEIAEDTSLASDIDTALKFLRLVHNYAGHLSSKQMITIIEDMRRKEVQAA